MILSTHLFCLLNLSSTPQLCPPLLLTYTFDVLYHIRQHNQLNTIRFLLCTIYYSRFTMRDLLCTMHYALYTMHLYVFIHIYYFISIHTYLLFNMEIRRNPVILVLTRSTRRVELLYLLVRKALTTRMT